MKLFEDGDPCFAPMLNALFAAFRGTAVMSGCEASATGTSRTVSITAGSVQINGEVVAVSAGSVTLDAGSTFDRYDLVSINASGSKIVTKGTTKRKCPTQPANTCLLAIVFVPAGATVIATGNVYDARMLASGLACDWISTARLRPVASDTVRWSKSGNVSVTIPTIYISGTARITFKVWGGWDGDYHTKTYATLKINGVTIYNKQTDTNITVTEDHAINGGDVISLSYSGGYGGGGCSGEIACDDTVPVRYPTSVAWPA